MTEASERESTPERKPASETEVEDALDGGREAEARESDASLDFASPEDEAPPEDAPADAAPTDEAKTEGPALHAGDGEALAGEDSSEAEAASARDGTSVTAKHDRAKPDGPRAKLPLPENVTRAARAFALGGRALDPNEPEPPDPSLARVLYAEAATCAARALLGDATVSLERAIDELASRGELGRVLGRKSAGAGTFASLLTDVSPTFDEMKDIEPSVAKLVEAAHGRRSLVFAERWRLAVVALFMVAALVATGVFFARQPLWKQFRYTASSTQAGYSAEGTLGSIGMSGLIFHTQDQLEPWVEIDLGKVRRISRVSLTQREDCCQERGIPLVVQVAGEDKVWVAVARKKEKFDLWEARFRARKVRYVRLSSPSKTILHYADVKIQ